MSNLQSDINMNRYHFNRYFIERKEYRWRKQICDAGEKEYRDSHAPHTDIKAYWKTDIDAYWKTDPAQQFDTFLGCKNDDEYFERIRQESEYESAISLWQQLGSAIFHFNEDLLQMLKRTDAYELPIDVIHSPYRSIYCYLGETELFPELSQHYRIDGVYIHYDSIIEEFKSNIGRIDDDAEKSVWYGDMSLPEWEQYKKERNAKSEIAERRYKQFTEDIDNFTYQKNEYYRLYTILFTFINRAEQIRQYTSAEILNEPVFHMLLQFDTHKSTVKGAIEATKNSTVPMDTFDDSVVHKNSLLNITNHPEIFDQSINLVFNLLAYLNWKDKDIIYRYPNTKLQDKIDSSKTEKQRKRNISKTESMGYRKIHFVGYQTKYPNERETSNSMKHSHWRRGHWRNQACGEGRKGRKLIWIYPTIVNQSDPLDIPTQNTIYDA